MQAIILAAGVGSRISEETIDKTKCMIRVGNETIIERLLRQLDSINLTRIIIVTGYLNELLEEYIIDLNISTPLVFINNPIYDSTNNIYSLGLCDKEIREDDTLLFESDLLLDDEIIKKIISEDGENIAVIDKIQSFMNGTTVKINGSDIVKIFVGNDSKETGPFKTVNVYKFSKNFINMSFADIIQYYIENGHTNVFYEKALSKLVDSQKTPFLQALIISGLKWYEIDNDEELKQAIKIFSSE